MTGLFRSPEFLTPMLLHDLRQAFGSSHPMDATIAGHAGIPVVDPSRRRAKCCGVPDGGLAAAIDEHFKALLPMLETHFSLPLSRFEPPQIIRYTRGDFYRPHVDTAPGHGEGGSEIAQRKVSAVIFLNGSAKLPTDTSFVGGALSFFQIDQQVTEDDCRKRITPVAGLLLAFRSSVCHEVLPVMAGERFTLVTWFS